MAASTIAYADKVTGDPFTGANATEVKTVVNTNASLLDTAQADADAAQVDATQALADAATAQTDIDNHIADAVGAHAATAISNTPSGNIAATTVQAAINELDTEKAALTQTDFISGVIETLADQDYKLVVKIPYGITITETTTICTSGTATATFKINTTALGGTANSVSTSEQSQAHGSSNVASADDDIVVTISSNSSCEFMSFTIKFTRTLS